jgi:Phytanoyl-CoA dioxygenase (PhyH)
MEFTRLEPDQRRAFDEDGFLVVRDAIDAEAVRNLVDASDRLAKAFLSKPVVLDKPEYNHLDLRPGLLREESMVALVSQPSIVPLVVQLLGPNIQLHSTALICKRPSNPDASPFRRGWHRDIRMAKDLGLAGLPRVGIKVCYCLTDFRSDACGMTLMARGTHLRSGPLVIREGQVDPEGVEVCDLRLDAGDALLFENRTFHTAAPNRSDRVSKVLMYGYAYRWMRPEVYLEVPDERLLERVDPVTRQLMGGYRDIDTPPWALQGWARRHGVTPGPVHWEVEAES